jgi:hypothetical protein
VVKCETPESESDVAVLADWDDYKGSRFVYEASDTKADASSLPVEPHVTREAREGTKKAIALKMQIPNPAHLSNDEQIQRSGKPKPVYQRDI